MSKDQPMVMISSTARDLPSHRAGTVSAKPSCRRLRLPHGRVRRASELSLKVIEDVSRWEPLAPRLHNH